MCIKSMRNRRTIYFSLYLLFSCKLLLTHVWFICFFVTICNFLWFCCMQMTKSDWMTYGARVYMCIYVNGCGIFLKYLFNWINERIRYKKNWIKKMNWMEIRGGERKRRRQILYIVICIALKTNIIKSDYAFCFQT